jgi:N,N'-diacetyllegionaminate synthase
MKFTKNKIYLIAEIGWNFLGNINLAKKMILSAKKSGADLIKFQIWDPKNLKEGPWDNDGRREIYEKSFLNKTKYNKLNLFCKKNKIKCFASIFSISDIDHYYSTTKDIVKIPSSESHNIDLIKKCIDKFNLVLLSLGALKENELKKILFFIRNKKNVIPLHCVSAYPLAAEDFNYEKLKFIRENSQRFGYSGHLSGFEDAIFAIEKGATVIEKHFTVDQELKGRDNKFALLPDDLKIIRNYIENKKKFEINKGLGLQKKEIDVYKHYRGRWSKND